MSILRTEGNFNPVGISDLPENVEIQMLSETDSEQHDFDSSLFEDDEEDNSYINRRMLLINALHSIIKDQLDELEKLRKDRKMLKERIDTLKNLLMVSKDPYILNVIKYL